jgi:TRAP-type C4-dicarboxylate transport system substrate-binding protein
MGEQPTAVRKGVIDFSFVPAVFYEDIVPEGYGFHLSELTITQERERGFIDYIREINIKKMNVYFLGRMQSYVPFYLATRKTRVSQPSDLIGLKISVPELALESSRAWGAVPVKVPLWENYGALERGVVDAVLMTMNTFVGYGVHSVSKYMVDHSLFEPGDSLLIMNLDKWNATPKNLQDLMIKVMIDMDPLLMGHFDKIIAKSRQTAIGAGMQPIKFSPADASWYRDVAYDAGWKEFESLVGRETTARIMDMIRK